MYGYKNGVYTNDDCSINKSIRLNPKDLQIVENAPGRNFSQKIKHIIEFYEKNQDFVAQN